MELAELISPEGVIPNLRVASKKQALQELAKYAAEGASVGLVCATNGEIGEISDPDLASSDTLGDVRIAELRCAAEALGVAELLLLGYRDSGMAGTADNEDPRAFGNAAEDEIVGRLVGIIRRVRPDVVVTFDPNGGDGHPDHVAANAASVSVPYDHGVDLPNIKAPSLIVWGRYDRMCVFEIGIAALNNIEDSRLVLLNNCGHWPPYEKPEEYTAHLLNFLENI